MFKIQNQKCEYSVFLTSGSDQYHIHTRTYKQPVLAKEDWEDLRTKRKRINHAASRKLRRLTGWNIFQREEMQKLGGLNPAEYKAQVRSLSTRWNDLPEEDKSAFHVQAAFEEEQRHLAQSTPLASKDSPAPDIESQVGRAGLKKMSVTRLQKNFEAAESHDIWSSCCQLGDRNLACADRVFKKYSIQPQVQHYSSPFSALCLWLCKPFCHNHSDFI